MNRSKSALVGLFSRGLKCMIFLLAASAVCLAQFTQCPSVGASTSCAVLVTINPNGALSVQVDPSIGPYDGIEDTLIGVINKSGATVFGISLSGAGIFGFDGDGLCQFVACSWPHPTGYEGPGTSFSINNSNSGIVNFTGSGLANGASTYFSLEEAPSQIKLSSTVTIDPGHGLTCPAAGVGSGQHVGTTGGGLREDDLTVAVSLALKPILEGANYTVVLTKADVNTCVDLIKRGEIANHNRSNIFVSVHFDKPISVIEFLLGKRYGSAGLYNSAKTSAQKLGGLLASNVSSNVGVGNRGAVVDNGTAVLKPTVTDMTAAIIEVARLGGGDVTFFQLDQANSVNKAAQGIKAGIDSFINQ